MKKILTIILLVIASRASAQENDIKLLRYFHNPSPLKSDGFFRFTSNSVAPVCIAVPLSYFAYGMTQSDKSLKGNLSFQQGIYSGMSILGAGLISYTLKFTITRDRPYVTYPDIQAKMKTGPHSFPSGHTTFAFATATALTLNHKKWYVAVPAFGYAITVGYSRLHLGVHYPSDVFTGAAIGTGTSVLMYFLSQKLFKQ